VKGEPRKCREEHQRTNPDLPNDEHHRAGRKQHWRKQDAQVGRRQGYARHTTVTVVDVRIAVTPIAAITEADGAANQLGPGRVLRRVRSTIG
jgi:hypothetical protein